MKTKPEELLDNGYTLLDKLEHKELIPFVKLYLKKRTLSALAYKCSNISSIGFIVFWFWKNFGTTNFHITEGINYFLCGIAMAFLLIPLHEYIHVLAYKSQGAEKTSYDVNWKKFYFMAVADKFVVSKKEFQIIALAPFVSITAVLILLFVFSTPVWSFALLGMLLTHTAFTSGDFALLSYFEYHKEKEIVSYDDKENGISYFYCK